MLFPSRHIFQSGEGDVTPPCAELSWSWSSRPASCSPSPLIRVVPHVIGRRCVQARPRSAAQHRAPFNVAFVGTSSYTPASDYVQNEGEFEHPRNRRCLHQAGGCSFSSSVHCATKFRDDVKFDGGARTTFTSYQVKSTIEGQ